MNKILTKLLMTVLLLTVWSCSNVRIDEHTVGYLSVGLEQDTSEDVVFKGTYAPAQDQIFTLDFVRTYKDGSTNIEYSCNHTEVPAEGVELPVGPYVVKASCGDNDEAAFNNPFYTGEASVNVVYGQKQSVDITCFLSNVKVTVDFAQEILDGFSRYEVVVSNSRGGTLTFSSEDGTTDNEGYFKVGDDETLTWVLNLTNNKGVTYTATETYSGVKAKEHYNFRFSLGEARPDLGGLYLTIKVDTSTEEKNYLAGVDFGSHAGPSISLNPEFEELLSNDPVTVPFGVAESKKFTLSSTEGIKSVVIAHSDSKLYAMGLPYMSELVGASSAQLNALKGIGVDVATVNYGSAGPVTIDVTDFMSALDMDQKYSYDVRIYDVYNHMAETSLDFTVVVNADADMVSVTPWAMFAVVKGKWFVDEQPEGLTFMYRKSDDAVWNTYNGVVEFDMSSKTFSADLMGLDPESEYVVKAVSSNDQDTREMTFSTDIAPQLYNMNFDIWGYFGNTYYPYLENATEEQKVWDSANPGTAGFSWLGVKPNTVYVEGAETQKGSGKAVKMFSDYVMNVKFAAGNIYTGRFGSTIGTSGAELDWGTEFHGRPVALKGYYKYEPAKIDYADKTHENLKGQSDKCQMLVLLTDWDGRFNVNTTTNSFVQYDTDPHIIGMAKVESDVRVSEWEKFCLPIEYRDLTRIPEYVVVVFSSSYLGDFFTGGKGSTMWVDELEFEYDLSDLKPEEKAKVNYK